MPTTQWEVVKKCLDKAEKRLSKNKYKFVAPIKESTSVVMFSEEEKNEMRRYNGPLPEDDVNGGEKMLKVAEELPERDPDGFRLVPAVRRLRRNARIIPMPALEPHGEDVIESEVEEESTEEYLEELKLRVDICREELEEQIIKHITSKL